LGGGCLLLTLLGGGCVVLLGVLGTIGASAPTPTPTPVAATPAAGPGVALPSAPASGNRFVNAKQGLTGELEAHYTPFSIDYPKGWKLDNKARTKGKFVSVSLKQDAGGGVSSEVAKVDVSWWTVENGGAKELIEDLKFEGNVKPIFRAAKFGGRDGWQALTSQDSTLLDGKTETLLITRMALPAQPGAKHGLFIIAFAVAGIGMGDKLEDLGTQGAFKTVLDSLVVGSDVAAASLASPCAISEADNCMECCGVFGHNQASGSGNRCTCH